MVIDVEVTDLERLNEYAVRRMTECFGEHFAEETPDTPRRVFEALVGSNEGPNPSDIGLDIVDTEVFFVR